MKPDAPFGRDAKPIRDPVLSFIRIVRGTTIVLLSWQSQPFLVRHDATKTTMLMTVEAFANHNPRMQTLAAGSLEQPQAKPPSMSNQDFVELWAPLLYLSNVLHY